MVSVEMFSDGEWRPRLVLAVLLIDVGGETDDGNGGGGDP